MWEPVLKFILSVSLIFFPACRKCPEKNAVAGSTINGRAGLFAGREDLKKILDQNGVLDPERTPVHFSHTCNLVIQGQQYPVIDVRELAAGAVLPRGVNQIVVLNPGCQLVQSIEYARERPLFCFKNKLYLYDTLRPSGSDKEGNVLEFSDRGYRVNLLSEDLNELIWHKKNKTAPGI